MNEAAWQIVQAQLRSWLASRETPDSEELTTQIARVRRSSAGGAAPVGPPRSPWQRVSGETRTRILGLYLLLMLLVAAISVPVFQGLLFAKVRERVSNDLDKEVAEFDSAYAAWQESDPQVALEQFASEFVTAALPEDDNFLLAIVDGQIVAANPPSPVPFLAPGSVLFARWIESDRARTGQWRSDDPEIGHVLYVTRPLVADGRQVGVFVVAHFSAGEEREILAGVSVFGRVALGVVLVASGLAWVATGRVLAPVGELVATARKVSQSDLSGRLETPSSGEMAELTDTFNAMMARLQAAFESQRDFINDAGHELRTPIAIARGHLELLGDDPEERRETVALLLDELDRMGRMVSDMLLLAKSERADFLHVEKFEVEGFMAEVSGKARALGDREWRSVVRGRGRAVADRQQLSAAMLNLAANAVQHTDAGAEIELGAALSAGELRLWVRDTGEGIPERERERIFERFARVAGSYRRSEGAGLGLAIVRSIAYAHGGTVELDSAVDVGSTFVLVIPLDPAGVRSS